MAALALGALAAAACGGNQQTACGEVENVFEPSSVHVLAGTDVSYELSPPTSGPHMVPAPDPGVYSAPISEPLQVGAVEAGAVIVQYRESVAASDVEMLEALAEDRPIIVAPAARALDDDSIVAFTAWGVRRLCSGVDLDAAREFIDTHAVAPGGQHE